MKTKIFFGIICMFIVLFALSCKTAEVAPAEQPKPEPQKIESKKPVFYMQSLLKDMSESDSLLVYKKAVFFNSCEINIEKYLSDRSYIVDEKGAVLGVDTLTGAQKKVEPLTPGGMLSVKVSKNYKGVIAIAQVSFSRKDANYQFSFWRTDDERFILNGNAIITVDEHPYRVIAKTSSPCYLLFNFDTKIVPKEKKGTAEGWTSGSSSLNSNSSSSPNTPVEKNKPKNPEGFQPAYIPVSTKPE